MQEEANKDYLSDMLSITREQLSRSLSAAAELEALLILERKKTKDLEKRNKDLETSLAASKDKKPTEN